jgi:hypothetical protein
MRTAFLIGDEYEWAHHVERARAAGLMKEEIDRIAGGADAAGWSEEHRTVLRAAEELRREASSPIAPGAFWRSATTPNSFWRSSSRWAVTR